MSKRTIILIGVLFLVTAGLIAIALSPKGGNQQQQTGTTGNNEQQQNLAAPSPTVKKTATLSFSPATVTLSGTGTIDVMVDAGSTDYAITGVQLELSYDPKVVRVVQVKAGSFFPNPLELLNSIDQGNGRVTYAVVAPPESQTQGQSGIAATITLQAIPDVPTNQTQLTFLPKSLVTAQGIAPSILNTTTPATITIGTGTTQQNTPVTQTAPAQ